MHEKTRVYNKEMGSSALTGLAIHRCVFGQTLNRKSNILKSTEGGIKAFIYMLSVIDGELLFFQKDSNIPPSLASLE
jgi:hypothetical protein